MVDDGSVGVFPTLPLLRFHGILMIIAWPLLAVCGIFFASWMRPALPNGQWFQVHSLLASYGNQALVQGMSVYYSTPAYEATGRQYIWHLICTVVRLNYSLGSSSFLADFDVHWSRWICCCFHCQPSFIRTDHPWIKQCEKLIILSVPWYQFPRSFYNIHAACWNSSFCYWNHSDVAAYCQCKFAQ